MIVSSHILPEIEAMTNEIILIHQGKIFAKGDIHRIRGLIDSHPHQVSIRCNAAAAAGRTPDRRCASCSASNSTHRAQPSPSKPTSATNSSTALHAPDRRGESGRSDEITSPDDNLQAVFDYLIGK